MRPTRAQVKRIASALIPIGILAVVIPAVWRHCAQLRQYHWTISPMLLASSFVALFAAFLLVVYVWTRLLCSFDLSLRFRRAFEIWYISNLGRYLPGKVWSLLGMIYLCEKEGLPRSKVVASGVVTQIFSISAAFFLGSIYLCSTSALKGKALSLPVLLVGLCVFLLPLVVPKFCVRCMGPLAKKLGAHEIARALRPADRIRFFCWNILCWLVYGLAFGLLILSISTFPASHFLALVPTFALAYTLGFIALFAPSGFGVREGVLVLLLSPFYPPALGLALALAARLWFTIGDIAFFLIAWQLQTGFYAKKRSSLHRSSPLLRPALQPEQQPPVPYVHIAAVAQSCDGSEYSGSGREA